MANEEHLAILRQGVMAWNTWREANPDVEPDLSRAHLSGAILNEADLGRAIFNEADLSRAHLSGAILSGAILSRANLFGANLSEVDLSEADLSEADLREAYLSEAHLSGAILSGAILSRADLNRADLSRADLSRARLIGARLIEANLSGARLIEANLSEATVSVTVFGDNDLSDVKGLDRVHHRGPSIIGTNTLYRSGGKIPEAFLRGCGVQDSMIEYLPSLIGAMQPIQFYSCFISYSTEDEDFAKRLHGRMQQEHLRVWFAPEDMEGGKKIHEQVERAIQRHDRLLLILSDNSLQSEWVMTELYNARQVELKENRRKLFPIRLADMHTIKTWKCFDADTGKDLAREVREYYIPDFSHWKNHDAFEHEFAKLLNALKATEAPPTLRASSPSKPKDKPQNP